MLAPASRSRAAPLLLALFAACSATCSSGAMNAGPPGDGGGADGFATPAGEPWATYGHDPQRTFASTARVPGALQTLWRYVPQPATGRTLNYVVHAIATSDAIFLAYAASDAPYLGTTAIDRVSTTGAHLWTFDSGTDSNLGNWPSLAFGALVSNDDGNRSIDPATGMQLHGNIDAWGQTTPDVSGLAYEVNVVHVDGDGLYVGARDATGKLAWSANRYGKCRIDAGDASGGIALDGPSLFYAPSYSPGMGVTLPFSSGVYAFASTSGMKQWFVATTSTSTLSAGGGHVYLIEGGSALVARRESDGSIAWSQPLSHPGGQAPVLADGLVIVATDSAVLAFHAASGTAAWETPLAGAAAPYLVFDSFSGGCVGGNVGMASALTYGVPSWSEQETTSLAAALGSGTLIVTAPDGVHVLALASGASLWSGAIAQAVGRVRDPVIAGNAVYVVDSGGLLALGPKP